MARNIFTDPSGDRPAYSWAINHSDEAEFGKERTIEHSANTGNTGLIKQQNDDSPLVMQLNGTILSQAQHVEFIEWWKICKNHTIFFEDFAGDEYEVVITAYKPTRQRTIRNPRDYANAPLWYWKYELKLEVIRVISGTWAGVAP